MKRYLVALACAIIFGLMASNASYAEEKGASKRRVPEENGSTVSRAVHKAQEEGLKGEELAERAHQAIQERKEAHKAEKATKMEAKKMRKQAKVSSGTKIQVKARGKGKR